MRLKKITPSNLSKQESLLFKKIYAKYYHFINAYIEFCCMYIKENLMYDAPLLVTKDAVLAKAEKIKNYYEKELTAITRTIRELESDGDNHIIVSKLIINFFVLSGFKINIKRIITKTFRLSYIIGDNKYSSSFSFRFELSLAKPGKYSAKPLIPFFDYGNSLENFNNDRLYSTLSKIMVERFDQYNYYKKQVLECVINYIDDIIEESNEKENKEATIGIKSALRFIEKTACDVLVEFSVLRLHMAMKESRVAKTNFLNLLYFEYCRRGFEVTIHGSAAEALTDYHSLRIRWAKNNSVLKRIATVYLRPSYYKRWKRIEPHI